jgi:hypothetical protein
VNFAFSAMCSDALRCAGMRSSGGLRARFHGDNTGSNPVGDANRINTLQKYLPNIRGCKKPHFCVLLHPQADNAVPFQ